MKILVAIANYGTKNMGFLSRLIREYHSMPEQVDIVVLSNIPKDLGPGIEVKVGLPAKNPWSLPFGHKKIFAERVDEYDLFIYSEDDTLITEKNIRAFLDMTSILPEDEIAGFLRYELDPSGMKYYSTVHSHFHWIPDSVRTINGHTFARFTNDHSACYLLTQKHLRKAIDSGGFLVGPHEEQYDLLVTAATDPYTQCGMRKVICVSNLEGFELYHLPNVYIGKLGLAEGEFRRQIEVLMKIAANGSSTGCLFPGESRFKQARWSKSYYEKSRNDILALVSDKSKNILSVGCGWGATEEALVQRGNRVDAIPLDSIIGSCAEAKGIEVTFPDFDKAYIALSKRRFDCIIFSEVLQYLLDPVKILNKYAALLTEEGIIIISVQNFNNVRLRRELAQERISIGDISNFDKTGLHLSTKRKVNIWVEQSNLKIVHSHYGLEGRVRRFAHIIPAILRDIIAAHYLVVVRKAT
jgi:2-polyprenyl-3-methyl-5-hydroxy-6-metoxy-1,4-benzoquinol methylase